ncbi:MAG: hypothetical protein HMLKMBBP_03372 [Planctomycetes bacterium]|nr:hypothetical protein [Planctomycetota bacterium]
MQPGRASVRLLGWIFAILAVGLTAETWYELERTGVRWDDLRSSSGAGKALASTVSRAFNNLLAMVLAFVSVAIPLTANMYTPKLVEIFFSDKLNIAGLVFFAVMGAHAVFGQWIMFDQWAPVTHVTALWLSGVIGFAVLVPYYLYVLDFLNPSTIIRRCRDRVTEEYGRIGRGGIRASQRRLHDRIMQLGNVILRAVDRADRDVAIDAIDALEHATLAYRGPKASAPAEWFEAPPELFPGASAEAIALLHREKTWVESRALSQLHLAYVAALAKMPDAVSAISLVNRRIALHAAVSGDGPMLSLALRYFNTYVRTAVAKRDLHAVYDVFHQYRALATELLDHPGFADRARDAARHMRYYAELARFQGMVFVYELAAAEVAGLVEAAYVRKAACARQLLDELRAFHKGDASGRLTKAESVLLAWFVENGRADEAAIVRKGLEEAPRAMLEAAHRDLTTTVDPVFWEITDRQVNLDYVEPARRAAVDRVLREILDSKS